MVLPGNIFALKYFLSRKRDLPTQIYLLTSITDIIVCSTSFPVLVSFLYKREPVMFSNQTFCALWGLLWDALPIFPVFLVLVLSISRTIIIVNPFAIIKKKIVMLVIAVYGAFYAPVYDDEFDWGRFVANQIGCAT